MLSIYKDNLLFFWKFIKKYPTIFGLNQKCPEFSSKMSGILDPRIMPFRSSASLNVSNSHFWHLWHMVSNSEFEKSLSISSVLVPLLLVTRITSTVFGVLFLASVLTMVTLLPIKL